MTRRRLALAVGGLGGLVLLATPGWWWIVYQPVLTSDLLTLPRALPCMVAGSDLCTLAQALCRADHPLGIRHYYTGPFWIGMVLLGLSLLLPSGRRIGRTV